MFLFGYCFCQYLWINFHKFYHRAERQASGQVTVDCILAVIWPRSSSYFTDDIVGFSKWSRPVCLSQLFGCVLFFFLTVSHRSTGSVSHRLPFSPVTGR